MRMIFCVLCAAMCSGIAVAQETSTTNFEACVSESKQRRTDAEMKNYLSYKCDGLTARKLAARPDQCTMDVRPLLRNIERHTRQFEDGMYQRMIWRTEVCAGMCETRYYSDGRAPNYLCEVRRHVVDGRVARPSRNDRRDASEDQPRRRLIYPPVARETARDYREPAPYSSRRRAPAVEADARRARERWIYYSEPDRYREDLYRSDDPDDGRARYWWWDDYRRGDYP